MYYGPLCITRFVHLKYILTHSSLLYQNKKYNRHINILTYLSCKWQTNGKIHKRIDGYIKLTKYSNFYRFTQMCQNDDINKIIENSQVSL